MRTEKTKPGGAVRRMLAALSAGGLAIGFGYSALADHDPTNPGVDHPIVLEETVCMEDRAGFGLNCTANDVRIADVIELNIIDPCEVTPDGSVDTTTFEAIFEVILTAQERHDIGLYFATDGDPNGDGAITGECTVATPPYSPDPPWLDLDGTTDKFPGTNVVSNEQDVCGDIDDAHSPLGGPAPAGVPVTLTAQCIDFDGDGLLNLPNCTSWRQPGANDLCLGPVDAFPGAPSKCNCDPGFNLPIPVPFEGSIQVDKVVVPADDPGLFNLEIVGVTTENDVGDGGTTGPVMVSAGNSLETPPIGRTYMVQETAGTGTDLSNYDTTISCIDQDGDTANASNAGPVDVFVEGRAEIDGGSDDWICTITNMRRPATLTLVKNVINDDGGTAVATEWTLSASGPTPISGAGGTGPTDVAPGTYTLSETPGPAGYAASAWSCDGGSQSGNQVTLESNDDVTCTITNDDISPTLTVIKTVINDNGGTAQPDDFNLTVDGNPVLSGATNDFNAGAHIVAETLLAGYAAGSWGGDCNADGTITLALDQDATCTITNDDISPTLTVIKTVINDNGGTAAPDDFNLTVDGNPVLSGATNDFNAGAHTVAETLLAGYAAGDWGGDCNADGTITLALDQHAICTITNDDISPTLTLIKTVINDDGGTAAPDDFDLAIDGVVVLSGAVNSVNAGAHTASETLLAGYAAGDWGGDCNADGTITLALDQHAICTITNDDISPTLTLIKTVINDDGGTAAPDDFDLAIDGVVVLSGAVNSVNAGAHTASETLLAGYSAGDWGGDCNADGTITLALAQDAICTITNDDISPTLTVIKTVINDNGGTAVPDDFNLTVDGNPVLSGATNSLSAGAHTVAETLLAGYTAGPWGGDCNADGSITLALAQDATCTITNNDQPPGLTLIKVVTNDNGGTAVADAWTLTASGPTGFSGPTGVSSGADFEAGTYDLSELGPGGYTASDWVCVGGTQDDGDTITVGLGENATCTITNDDDAPSLTLVKILINDNGGTAVATDWTLTATGPTGFSGTTGISSGPSFDAGTYDLSETGPAGYEASDWVCVGGTQDDGDTITLGLGESATCTITNGDLPPGLTLFKQVVNDDGGTALVTDWTLTATGPTGFSGTSGVSGGAGFAQGTYDLSEIGPIGYAASAWVCVGGTQEDGDTITVGLGEAASCTITNNDISPTLTVIKTVVNDNGGTAAPDDFNLTVDGNPVLSGATNDFDAGAHTVAETLLAGYTAGPWGGDCAADGSITLSLAQNATCTITNNDQPPSLTLIKVVDNGANPGGTAVATDWILTASGLTGFSGTTGVSSGAFFSAGTYDLSESGPADYVASDWVCAGGTQDDADTITLGLGESATCTITNTAKGMVSLLKLTNGIPNETLSFDFTLTGPGVDATDSSPPTTVDFGGVKLMPGGEYRLCETGIPAGWNTEWTVDTDGDGVPDTIIPHVLGVNNDPINPATGYSRVFDPNFVVGDYVNDTRCVNFRSDAGETLAFEINNQPPPGGEPRTIGYWKNWNTCSKGNQAQTAAKNGGVAEGFYLLDDLLPQLIGVKLFETCDEARLLLDKRDIVSERKMARDAAYGLAAQLMAAQLNFAANAATCPAAMAAAADGQTLLVAIGFNGTGDYLRPRDGALYQDAVALAGTLDAYNNGTLCPVAVTAAAGGSKAENRAVPATGSVAAVSTSATPSGGFSAGGGGAIGPFWLLLVPLVVTRALRRR